MLERYIQMSELFQELKVMLNKSKDEFAQIGWGPSSTYYAFWRMEQSGS